MLRGRNDCSRGQNGRPCNGASTGQDDSKYGRIGIVPGLFSRQHDSKYPGKVNPHPSSLSEEQNTNHHPIETVPVLCQTGYTMRDKSNSQLARELVG